MKKSILLVLLYLLIQSIAALGVALGLGIMSQEPSNQEEWATIIALLLADVVMGGILIWKGYLSDRQLWEPTTVTCLGWTIVASSSAIFIADAISSLANFLPDWLENTFSNIETNWAGVLAIAIAGPILEEMLFRGVITTTLLKSYSPKKAVIYSALIFGIFHLNPAQILVATLLGFLLGWLFYKTHSLIPCIIVHILNNSLSVYLSQTYPKAESFQDIIGMVPYFIVLALAVLLLALSIRQLLYLCIQDEKRC